jgi:hypothetical protein
MYQLVFPRKLKIRRDFSPGTQNDVRGKGVILNKVKDLGRINHYRKIANQGGRGGVSHPDLAKQMGSRLPWLLTQTQQQRNRPCCSHRA